MHRNSTVISLFTRFNILKVQKEKVTIYSMRNPNNLYELWKDYK